MALCTNVRQAVYEKYATGDAPGPVYSYDASIGKQPSSRRKNLPAYSFGTSKRDHRLKDDSPAPGAYDAARTSLGRVGYDSRKKSAAVTRFGTSKRDAGQPRSVTPGPVYNVAGAPGSKTARSAPSYSMGRDRKGRLARSTAAETPGPGAYGTASAIGDQRVSTRPSSARVRFGTSSRDSGMPRSVTPGPVYNVAGAPGPKTARKAPAFSMGRDRKDRLTRSTGAETPGPGAYGCSSTIGEQRVSTRPSSARVRFGTSTRDSGQPRSVTPGPVYNISDTRSPSRSRRAPSFSMGRERKGQLARTTAVESPGPGAYGTTSAIGDQRVSTRPSSARVRFGTSTRDFGVPKSSTPAPGTYGTSAAIGSQSLSNRQSAPGYSFGNAQRDEGRPRSATPGPGNYGTVGSIGRTAVFPTSPITKFGTSHRDALYPRSSTPGPVYGVYETIGPQSLSSKPSAARVAFGKSSRFDRSPGSDTPAPNAYGSMSAIGNQTVSTRRNTPAFTMGAR